MSNHPEHTGHEFRFCFQCGQPLHEQFAEGRMRPVCTGCGKITYVDPKLAAACIPTYRGKLLLIQRAHEPAIGSWTFPGGYIDRFETVEEAARRETLEETGLQVDLTGLVGVFSYSGRAVVTVVFSGDAHGTIALNPSEALDHRLVSPAEIPWDELAFPSIRDSLKLYLESLA